MPARHQAEGCGPRRWSTFMGPPGDLGRIVPATLATVGRIGGLLRLTAGRLVTSDPRAGEFRTAAAPTDHEGRAALAYGACVRNQLTTSESRYADCSPRVWLPPGTMCNSCGVRARASAASSRSDCLGFTLPSSAPWRISRGTRSRSAQRAAERRWAIDSERVA